MAHQDHSLTPDRDAASTGALLHSHDVEHFKIPDGDPDPRGWDVRTADGQTLGKVEELMVDTTTGRVRYLEVKVDKDVVKAGGREWALVPVGAARLDDDRDDVVVNLSLADIAGIPAYERGPVSRDYEQSLRSYVRERPDRVRAADVAATGAGATGAAGVGREADFYTGPEYDDRSFFGSRRASGRGVGGELADALDDMKDRVDANPASRPGPDATDRPGYGTADARPVDRAEGAVERGARRAGNALDDVKDRVDANPASRPGPDATDRPERR